MNIKSRMVSILILLISFQANCFLSKLTDLPDSTCKRTKKAIENITLKDVAACTVGAVAFGLVVHLMKQNHDIQAQIGDLKDVRLILDGVAQQQKEFNELFTAILETTNRRGQEVLDMANEAIATTRESILKLNQRQNGQLVHINDLQAKYKTLSEWVERFKDLSAHLEKQST